MVKTNPNSLLKKYKKREKRKTWRSKEAGDKLNRFLSNSIERKPFFSKKIDEYLNNQIISILNNKFRDLGKVKRYKNKLYVETTEKYDDFLNSLTEEEHKISQILGEKVFNDFLVNKLIENFEDEKIKLGVSKNG